MNQLTYQEIQKDLDALYIEHCEQSLTINQHIGRCVYEYEQVIDPEEERNTESFFFYLAITKQLMNISETINLNSIFPEAIKFLATFNIQLNNLQSNEALEVLSDYKMVREKIEINRDRVR